MGCLLSFELIVVFLVVSRPSKHSRSLSMSLTILSTLRVMGSSMSLVLVLSDNSAKTSAGD